ncbi:unnamed protein product [Effrenium voratum]|uniref:CRAL-TRIO domain-containing protein n=1 Tax=Effrenium voratum TaxID=2562239 RepID=A0AA36ITE1_9DINO|nr:unnamed protein product [Effrenium voratum]
MAWPLERETLGDLLFRHRHAVAALRASLHDELEAQPADEVWLLRYVLSFQDEPQTAAASAAKAALAWRKEHAGLVAAAAARQAPSDFSDEELSAIYQCFVAGYFCCTQFGDPVFLSRLSAYNLKRLMEKVSEPKLELWFNFTNECAWQYCEAETRARQYFVKQINIQDSEAVRMAQNRPFLRALGNSSKVNDWLRPQLFGKTYVFNPPVWLSMAHRVAGGIMSRKSLAKIWVHPGSVNAKTGEENGLCPFAQQLFGDASVLPTFLGGRCSAEAFPSAPRSESSSSPPRQPPLLAGLPPVERQAPQPQSEREDSDLVTFQSAEDLIAKQALEGSQLPVSLSMCSAVTAREVAERSEEESSWPPWCRRVCCFRRRRRSVSQPLI